MRHADLDADFYDGERAGEATGFNYRRMFDEIAALLCAANAVVYRPHARGETDTVDQWVRVLSQIAGAPIWDDRRAAEIIADWSDVLFDMLDDGMSTYDELDAARRTAIAELRGELPRLNPIQRDAFRRNRK